MAVERKESSPGDAAAEPSQKRAKLAARWGGREELLQDGFIPVVRPFVKYASQLKPHGLNPAESLFIINLLYHKWDAKKPYPSYKTIAGRMGVSIQYTRDIARRLERKGLILREVRVGRPNRFDLQPLFDALSKHVAETEALKTTPPKAA